MRPSQRRRSSTTTIWNFLHFNPCFPRFVRLESLWQQSVWMKRGNLLTAIQIDMSDLNFAIPGKIRQIQEEAFLPTGDKKAAMNREADFTPVAKRRPDFLHHR